MKAKPNNPWGITDREARILDHTLTTGSGKVTALELGIPSQTQSDAIRKAMHRMGARTRLHLLIQWDRFRRTTEITSESAALHLPHN